MLLASTDGILGSWRVDSTTVLDSAVSDRPREERDQADPNDEKRATHIASNDGSWSHERRRQPIEFTKAIVKRSLAQAVWLDLARIAATHCPGVAHLNKTVSSPTDNEISDAMKPTSSVERLPRQSLCRCATWSRIPSLWVNRYPSQSIPRYGPTRIGRMFVFKGKQFCVYHDVLSLSTLGQLLDRVNFPGFGGLQPLGVDGRWGSGVRRAASREKSPRSPRSSK